MGDSTSSHKAWDEISQWVAKFLVWSFYIMIGIVAKLAFDSRTHPLTKRQIIIKTVLSVFVGFLASVLCENYGAEKWGKVIVPVATLVGEGLLVYMMSNYRKLAAKFLPEWVQNIFK